MLKFDIRNCFRGICCAIVVATSTNYYLLTLRPVNAETSAIVDKESKRNPHRLALLVAVSRYSYDATHTQDDLNTDADVDALESVLLSPKYDFKKEDIKILNAPETTTRQSIISAFNDLIAKTQAGDIVYFHFSGHGCTFSDPTLHKLSGDSQGLVPHDYDAEVPPATHEIIDIELHDLINRLVAKQPLLVTMSFDCCFSGSITRGSHNVRGFRYHAQAAGAGLTEHVVTPNVAKTITDPSYHNLVVLAASGPDQEAVETDGDGRTMGLFTYALTKALAEAKPNKTTYRDIMEQVHATVSDRAEQQQDPQCEGELDNVLMSGVVLPAQPSIEVEQKRDSRLVLKAGSLQNMTKGSIFYLYPSDTKDFDAVAPLTTAKIGSVGLIESDLIVEDSSIDISRFPRARAREKQHAFGSKRLTVSLQGLDEKTNDLISAGLPESEGFCVEVSSLADEATRTKWNVRIRKPDKLKDEVVLESEEGIELDTCIFSPNASNKALQILALKRRLEEEFKWRFVRAISTKKTSASSGVEMRLVPRVRDISSGKAGPRKYIDKPGWTGLDDNNQPSFSDQENFAIELRNVGEETVYVNVIEVLPCGLIGPIYPLPAKSQVDDNKLYRDPERKWHRLPKTYNVSGPFGLELLKVISTSEPTDFSLLFNARKTRTADIKDRRANLSRLVEASGSVGSELDNGDWSEASLILETHKSVK